MGTFIWATSDVLILISIFYVSLILLKQLSDNFVVELVIATIIVNVTAPIVAKHLDTPLYRLVTSINWLYFWPISALSIVAIVAAFIFERSQH